MKLYLIEILHQTTTLRMASLIRCPLYLIEILHQTTTLKGGEVNRLELYLIEILHQTTTSPCWYFRHHRCILLKFYIKPQQRVRHKIGHSVVSYWNSTSNHNSNVLLIFSAVVVSYWNSTSNHNSEFVIKSATPVVSYWNSTSNHNIYRYYRFNYRLYLIEILHQTTTSSGSSSRGNRLYLIEILHQTTTAHSP